MQEKPEELVYPSQTSSGKSAWRAWTTGEVRYLRQHRAEGSAAISEALGRTQWAVERMARRKKIRLGRKGPGEVCPLCATYRIAANTSAAKHGMCVVCYERRKADARRQAVAEDDAHREYEKEKKAAQRRLRNEKQALPRVRQAPPDGPGLPEVPGGEQGGV